MTGESGGLLTGKLVDMALFGPAFMTMERAMVGVIRITGPRKIDSAHEIRVEDNQLVKTGRPDAYPVAVMGI